MTTIGIPTVALNDVGFTLHRYLGKNRWLCEVFGPSLGPITKATQKARHVGRFASDNPSLAIDGAYWQYREEADDAFASAWARPDEPRIIATGPYDERTTQWPRVDKISKAG